ncbi:MAG: amidohydrolase [Halieaceae bacterium]|nr:MAG: amidohydrolase [Halieaceae bacterium]
MRKLFFSLTTLMIPMVLQAQPEAFPSTYEISPGPHVLFKNATILTGDGRRLNDTDLYIANGQIQWVGAGEIAPDATEIDASDRWITPGLIDVHSHLGVYPSPGVAAHSDGNEATAPVTAEVWAEHSVWPQDPGFSRALAGGVTAMQVLPGSANLFGGRGVTLKNVPSISYQGMKFPDAPYGLKMACGENPKRVYGGRTQAPSTRMGNVAAYRSAWIRAQRYQADWDRYNQAVKDAAEAAENDSSGASVASALLTNTPPHRNLELDTLAGALRGDIIVHMHCYRADEMLTILDMAEEFGYRVGTFHHGVEAYKIADELAKNDVCGALWADWWGFKIEAYDGIQENIALVDRPTGGCAIVHSDSDEGIQRLNQEAAKAMLRGNRAGLDIPPERAIRWITYNAAKSLGVNDQTGSIENGKMADVVLWNQDPFSVYAKPLQVYIDGVLRYEQDNPSLNPQSDFELGQLMGAAQ